MKKPTKKAIDHAYREWSEELHKWHDILARIYQLERDSRNQRDRIHKAHQRFNELSK